MENATVIGGNLNMRADTDVKSNRITIIPDGANVAVVERGLAWCKLIYNAYTGYAMTRYLKFDSEGEDETITITISKQTAKELYDALKLSLSEE